MKKFSVVDVVHIIFAFCVGFAILFQKEDDMQLDESEITAYHAHDSVLEILLDLMLPNNDPNDQEITDITELEEFLTTRPIVFQCPPAVDTSKNKIPSQQRMRHQPILEIATPPPWMCA